jgi:hypothetical protein
MKVEKMNGLKKSGKMKVLKEFVEKNLKWEDEEWKKL